jgi:outer membrane receptor for ferrienterochelin and colicins
MKIRLLYLLFCLISIGSIAQNDPKGISGRVFESDQGQNSPAVGANVYWSGTTVGTVTNEEGIFNLVRIPGNPLLVVSFIGFTPDTINTGNKDDLTIILSGTIQLDRVEVVKRNKSTELSMIDPLKVEKIGEGELEKAACCNLSESFETNPSVDVSFTDAITGTKQIQMLGLAGPYTQITRENIPDMRGLLSIYGLEYIPGPWIESIQLNKGTGSVANGYESIAGQINVELRKPETADRIYLNLFANEESRFEANLNLTQRVNSKWSTMLLLHGREQLLAMDRNGDGFTDKPTGNQYIFLNRWNYSGEKGWRSQFGIKATHSQSVGGQTGFSPEFEDGLWGMQMITQGIDGWLKLGRIFPSRPYQSFGFQLAGTAFTQESGFGLKSYDGIQQSVYANFIFQSIIGDSRYKYRTGGSFQYEHFDESLDSNSFNRRELVPGIFIEYTWSPAENFDLVAGMRADHHNQYGLFFTPRLHLRYAPAKNTVIRLSGGRGERTASVLSENISVLASSRAVIIEGDGSLKPYGLNPEVAWNFGGSVIQKFKLDYREGALSFDLYHTLFQDQVVVDLDENPREVRFYNLDGRSYSTSFQSQLDYELIRRLDVRFAYRWYDVKTDYASGFMNKPLIASHRAFMNLAYATRNHWKFDYTLQWYGSKRLPDTRSNPEAYQLAERSPSFFLMNAQISKEWREKFEIYLGVENLLNLKQENPIIASDQPFSPYFDSSIIWGPVFGRMVYGGVRVKIK